MGQARQRKAEIAALKAAGSKKSMAPFMIRGTINPDGTVSFPTEGLDTRQQEFVVSCERQINIEQVPEMIKRGTLPTQADSLAYVMYHNPEDFIAALVAGINGDPDDAWQENYQHFLECFNSKPRYPQIGDCFSRTDIERMGTKDAGSAFDLLPEGGRWAWPNARAMFERRGDRLVVVESLDVA